MRRRREGRWPAWGAALAVAICTSACTVHVFSPPAAAADLRPASTLGEGRVAAGGSAGFHVSPGVFSDTTTAGALGAHVGLGVTDDVDVHAAYQRLRIDGDTGNDVDADRLRGDASDVVHAGRVGVTGQIVPRRGPRSFVLSADGGLGAGGSDAGAFVAPDVALRVGWEAPLIGLFLNVRWAPSIPVSPRAPPLDLDAFEDGASVSRLTPRLTHMARVATGLRVTLPFDRDAGHDRNGRPLSTALQLLLAFVYTEINDTEERLPFFGGVLAVEVIVPGLWGGAEQPTPIGP